jgi:hypothetical protein
LVTTGPVCWDVYTHLSRESISVQNRPRRPPSIVASAAVLSANGILMEYVAESVLVSGWASTKRSSADCRWSTATRYASFILEAAKYTSHSVTAGCFSSAARAGFQLPPGTAIVHVDCFLASRCFRARLVGSILLLRNPQSIMVPCGVS